MHPIYNRPLCRCGKVTPTAGKNKDGTKRYKRFCTECKRAHKYKLAAIEKAKLEKSEKEKFGTLEEQARRKFIEFKK